MSSQTIFQQFQHALTMNGAIPVSYTEQPLKKPTAPFSAEQIDQFIARAKANQTQSQTDSYLYQALAKFPIEGKKVAVLGSTSPWYESILLAQGAIPVTISNEIVSTDPRIKINTTESSFDAMFALLHFRSLGLGIDIDPNADLNEMKKAKSLLKSGGLLYLSIPVGKDRLVWNSHRIYGELRMKALFKGWRPVAYFGYTYEDLWKDTPRLHEPVIVLKPV